MIASGSSEKLLDHTNWEILRHLQADARLSYHELGRRVGLSAPAVSERVRRLEEEGRREIKSFSKRKRFTLEYMRFM
jgi:DNA-binding Lrp family transcriptional regulator